MSISIYTYSNPYLIDKEPYWDSIKNCAHFCVSQTLVNGMEECYEELRKGQVITVEKLVEKMFPKWNDVGTYIEQYACIDRIITDGKFEDEKIVRSLRFNKRNILDSIRLLVELNFDLRLLNVKELSEEQKYIVAFYKYIFLHEEKQLFQLRQKFTEKDIKYAVQDALMDKSNRKGNNDNLQPNTIVFHGIHQFSPLILRTVEEVAKYYRVVFMFNYQQRYYNIYQTWIDIYSCFDIAIKGQYDNEFVPSPLFMNSYEGNVLAERIAQIADGIYNDTDIDFSKITIDEFDNVTEFANYVAKVYEEAIGVKEEKGGTVLSHMKEQFYAANNEVNDILKVYFPEQFGERHFLAYPIGHFFLAITNMWDAEKGGCLIENLDDVRECLCAGIIKEEIPGSLSSTFNQSREYFSKAKNFKELKRLVKQLKKRKKYLNIGGEVKSNEYLRLSYFQPTVEEFEALLKALEDLEHIAQTFFDDFENKKNDFMKFYQKIRECIEERVLPSEDLDDEFAQVLERLMERLEGMEVDEFEAFGSYECLKDTMSVYLKQKKNPEQSANWIVRDFQQIDGDVLLTGSTKYMKAHPDVVYHFACLSDQSMNVKNEEIFPWPLDKKFFEVAYEPLDWKYQVFVKSKSEYKNFKRYALVYGLLFNRANFRLSYVKNSDDRENEVYYLLKLLNLNIKKKSVSCDKDENISLDDFNFGNNQKEFKDLDVYRARICPYRFHLESILQDGVQYKEHFIMLKYFEIILANKVRLDLAGQVASDIFIEKSYKSQFSAFFEKVNRDYGEDENFVLTKAEQESIKLSVKSYLDKNILKGAKYFPKIKKSDKEYMKRKEEFLYLVLKDEKVNVLENIFSELSQDEVNTFFENETLFAKKPEKNVGIWCKYCAEKEICLESYKEMINLNGGL